MKQVKKEGNKERKKLYFDLKRSGRKVEKGSDCLSRDANMAVWSCVW